MAKMRAVVIGSGFGGLAAAIRLQAHGFQTTLFEKRDRPGGRAYVYHDKGFVFDAGPTVITAPHCLQELFQTADRRMEDYVELIPVHPFYRLHWEDGTSFDYVNDTKALHEQIRKMSPPDVQGYERFLSYTKEVFHEGYENLVDVPFLNFGSMIRVAPKLLKLSAYRSVYKTVGKYIKDPRLRQGFSFHSLLIGGNPFSASSIYTLIHTLERKWGVFFPRGGTGRLVEALVQLFEDIGGEVRLNCPVQKIKTRDHKIEGVQLQSGTMEPFDLVVVNADIVHAYKDLLAEEPQTARTGNRIASMSHSMSLFLIYFGTRKKYPGLAQHNVIFGSRYKGLLNDIFNRGVLADDFSLYLHAPSVTDPSLAPPEGETFYVLSPVPHLGKTPIDWTIQGPRYAEKILSYLGKNHLPGLKENIVTQRIFTPLDFKNELNAHLGSAFSVEPLLTQSAYFRPHNKDPRIKGLYFAGAGTHPGAGIPGVVNSAKAAVSVALRDYNLDLPKSIAHGRSMITKGSKSFSLAARIFGAKTRDAAFALYGWCRYCDDQIDDSDHGMRRTSTENLNDGDLSTRLDNLKKLTRHAYAGERMKDPIFIAFQHVVRTYSIPAQYPLDLLEGMAMDVRRAQYETLDDLLLYCYRVAGTVGLMMSHIMGTRGHKACKHANDMGCAMQLTNIARDIMDDAAMGRVYLPVRWLKEENLDPKDIAEPQKRPIVARLVKRLLDEAEKLYQSGDDGLKYLPFRAACAVGAARHVYSEIGRRILKKGPRAWDERTIVPLTRKLYVMCRGIAKAVSSRRDRDIGMDKVYLEAS